MTEFENIIIKNKKKLEPSEVNPIIWLAIENEILKSKKRRSVLYLKIVSVAASLFFGALIVGGNWSNKTSNIESELMEIYGFQSYQFAQKVSNRKNALSKAKIPSQYVEDFEVLLQQLEFLDEQYQDYLEYIEDNGYQSFIGDQLLNLYRSKIDLLDKIQQEINRVNYFENKFPSNDKQVVLSL